MLLLVVPVCFRAPYRNTTPVSIQDEQQMSDQSLPYVIHRAGMRVAVQKVPVNAGLLEGAASPVRGREVTGKRVEARWWAFRAPAV